MASAPLIDSSERLQRRRELRQQTVEKHRLLRKLGDEEAALVAQIAELSVDSSSPGETANRRAEIDGRLAAVHDQTARVREEAAAVKLEAAGLLEASRDESSGEVPEAPTADPPGSPGDLLARRAMARTNELLYHEIGADMRAFLCKHPAGTVEEWAAQSEWASDTGGARDERGLSLRVREGDWKRLFEEAALKSRPAGAAFKRSDESQLCAVVGRQYRCLSPAAVTAELDADAADPSLSFQLLEPGAVVLCEESAESVDGRQRLRCAHGWVSLVSMDGQQLLEELAMQSKFGLLQKALKSQVDIVRAEAKAMLDLESKPQPEILAGLEPEPEPEPAPVNEARAVLSGLGGSFMRILTEITERPSTPASSTLYEMDWRTRVPGRKPRRLPSVPWPLNSKTGTSDENARTDDGVEDEPSLAETSRNGIALWRCVAEEPVHICSAEVGLDLKDTVSRARRSPLWLAGPTLSGERLGTGRWQVWPGQIIKGRQRAASSWVRGPGDGRVLRRPRCIEILGASGGYNGSWVPLFDYEEEQSEELQLFQSLASETSAWMAPAPPRRGLAAVRMATSVHSQIGVKDIAFWDTGPLGLHFGKVAGGPRERCAEALGGVLAGDILIAVDGVPVLDTTSIRELQAAVLAAGRPLVLTFRTPLIRGTNPDALARHAEWLRRECRFWSAAAAYSMALAAGHAAPGWCLNQHGMCLGMAGTTLDNPPSGLLTEALLSFDKAIECEPGPRSAPRMYNRAYLLRRMGRLQDAAAGFGAAMNLDVNEAPRCSAAIAKIETQVRQRGAASAERHAPLSPESPPPVAEPVRAGGLYLCSCDQLQPKWRDLLPSSASAASVDNSVGLPKLQGGILETVAPPHANHATLVSRG